ncbi:deoxyribonuclease [Clostridia bacterium]|nr:deoxyribonuclease [Clostridia bacterium]
MVFDTHCHLDSERFDGDRQEIIEDMQARGVTPCVLVGCGIQSALACRDIARGQSWLYFAAAVHPHDASGYDEDTEAALRALMGEAKCVAWGEMGLDYYYDHSPREAQRAVFARQLDAAAEMGKPVILHVRDAHEDTLAMLRARENRLPPGVVHCFGGDAAQARAYLDLGMYISLAGSVTFRKADALREAARVIPADRLLVETDSPYLAPEPVRGRRNDPRNVEHVARFVAALREEPYEALCDATRRNGMRLFSIPEGA